MKLFRSLLASSIPLSLLVACTQQEPSLTDPLDPPEADTLVVAPQEVATAVDLPVTFAVPDSTILGNPVAGTVIWTATGGTIDASGVFVADSVGTYQVRAERGGRVGRARVVVAAEPAPPPPTLAGIEVSPLALSVAPGGSQQFAAIGRLTDGGTAGVNVTWSATGGTITTGGLYTSGPSAGIFRVIATEQGGSRADTSTVTVTSTPSTLVGIQVTPASISVAPRAAQQFSAVGRNSDGSSSSVTVNWTATGGSIAAGGLYTAGTTPGTFRVIAVRQGGTQADTSSVTITAPAPTLTAVEVTPTSASLAAGATQQFTALGRMSDGSATSVSVTWSETGGTITTGGLYTAGSTAGTFRAIAVRQGGTQADTANVTITAAPAPTLSSVEVTPTSASLVSGATQQFSAVGRMSDNSTAAVTVTWSATGGTMTTGGLYTAGSTAGSYQVIAVQQGGTKADTSAVTIAVPPPPSGGVANPTLLPLATGQTPGAGTYGRSLAAGQFYLDPISGVPVVKLTSPTSPSSGSHGHGYANGGPHVSQAWVGSDGKTYYTLALEDGGWLIDLRYDLIGVSDPRVNMRKMPYAPGEVNYAWSMNPATPRILFLLNGSTIVRYDTQAMSNAPSGIFPKAVPGGTWFQTQLNDRWMAGMSGTTYWALNTSTGTVINMSQARSGFTHDELHLDMTLPIVYLSMSSNKDNLPWLLDTDVLTVPSSWSLAVTGGGNSAGDPALMNDDHSTPVRGGMAGQYFGGEPYSGAYMYRRETNTTTAILVGAANFHSYDGDYYSNGTGNFFGFGGQFTDQWLIAEQWKGDGGMGKIRDGVIGFYKADGSSVRYLAAHDGVITNSSSQYMELPQSQMSPDGKLVFWTSNMHNSGTYQVFMARVPAN